MIRANAVVRRKTTDILRLDAALTCFHLRHSGARDAKSWSHLGLRETAYLSGFAKGRAEALSFFH